MCPGSPWNAFFPPDLFINFFCAPGKKKISSEKTILTFVLFEVIVQPCWHASLVQELILLSIRLFEQSTYVFFTKEKKREFDERNFIFFFDKEGAIAFFPISVCWAPILQLFRRCPGNNYCRYVAGILTIIGKPLGLVGAEQPICQVKKRLQAFFKNWKQFWRNLQQFPRT